MSIEIEGFDSLALLIRQMGERAERGVAAEMKLLAHEIADTAKKMAPVDEGNLEEAISVSNESGGRDSLGRFARTTFTVLVDTEKSITTSAGKLKRVGDYAYIIHEGMTPFGNQFKLGPKSIEKQQANPDVVVGGGFLDRAVETVADTASARLQRALELSIT